MERKINIMANKLAEMLATGELKPEDLIGAKDLIERAKLVKQAMTGIKQSIVFSLGEDEVPCYSYTDSAGEYESWGTCSFNGEFICFCNWGGKHEIGRCNLLDFASIFLAFDQNEEFQADLKRFLNAMALQAKNTT